MEDKDLKGWKSGTQQIPKPIEINDVNEDELIIKKDNKQ